MKDLGESRSTDRTKDENIHKKNYGRELNLHFYTASIPFLSCIVSGEGAGVENKRRVAVIKTATGI